MKKKILFLAFAISFFNFQIKVSQAQQVIIKGKYNGKMMTVKAQRAPGGDIIESISYAPLDDLKKEVANLKKQRDDLEKKYNETKRNHSSAEIRTLEDSLNSLNARLQYNESQLSTLQSTVESLADQLQQSEKELQNTQKELSKTQDSLRNLRNDSFIGFDAFWGASFVNNNLTKQGFWSRPISGAQKYHLTLTHYFSQSSPVALKVGLGLASYSSQGSFMELQDSMTNMSDIDGDRNETYYDYRNVNERVSLNYLDIPIQLHIGNNYNTDGIQAWVDAGVTVGLNVSKEFEGAGTYSSEAYYPEWNVSIHDVPELGLVSNVGIYGSDITLKVNKLVVWINAAIGVYIPFGKHVGLNMGARVDYSLTPLATNDTQVSRYIKGMPNLLAGDKTRAFSVGANIGLSYKF